MLNNNINSKKIFFLSLGILFFYCLMRFFIYKKIAVYDFNDWILRDAAMNLPRILCLSLIIFILLQGQNLRSEFSYKLKKLPTVPIVGALLISVIFLRSFFFDLVYLSWQPLALVIGSSFIVGFFEEILFRGAIFDSLQNWKGPDVAVWVSSLIFLSYHIQAQNIFDFPLIFLLGLLFSLLRRDGASLLQLSILHSIYDSVVLFWLPNPELQLIWRGFDFIFVLLIILCYSIFLSRISIKNNIC